MTELLCVCSFSISLKKNQISSFTEISCFLSPKYSVIMEAGHSQSAAFIQHQHGEIFYLPKANQLGRHLGEKNNN